MKLSGKLAKKGLKPFVEEKTVVEGHKMPKIWIVAANSEKAYFFHKEEGHLEKIGEAQPTDEPESEITNATAGRMSIPRGGGERHRFEVHDEALKHKAEEFMKALADFLHESVVAGAYDRLILAAAPKMLGTLRPQLSKEVQISLFAELDKDLMNLDERGLYEYLDKAFWI